MEKITDNIKPSFDGLQSKNKHISDLGKWIQDFSSDFNPKQRQLHVALKEIDRVLDLNRGELDSVQKELVVKKMQLGTIDGVLNLKREELDSCKKELTMKKNELSTVEKSIEERIGQLKSEDMKLLWMEGKLEKCSQDLSLKTEQLESMQKQLEVIEKEVQKVKTYAANCNEELELKQKGLAMVKSLISDSNSELELKQKQLETLQGLAKIQSTELGLKVKKLSGIEKSIKQCQNKLNWKMKEFYETQECLKEHNLKQKQLTEVPEKSEASSNAFSSKVKHFDSIKAVIDDNTEVLAKRKYDISNCSRVLKLKPKHLDSVAEEVESKEKQQDATNKAGKKSSAELKKKLTEVEFLDTQLSSKVGWTKKNLVSVQKRIKWLTEKYRSKEEDFNSLKATRRTYFKDLELEVREFNAIRESIRERNEELALKEKLLKSIQMSITERSKQLEPMKEELPIESTITQRQYRDGLIFEGKRKRARTGTTYSHNYATVGSKRL